MYKNLIKQILVALALAPIMAQAGNLPSPSIATSPGITIHYPTTSQEFDMMAAAGVKVVRTDFYWANTEMQQGVYYWAAYDLIVSSIVSRGMRPYLIMDFSNPLYDAALPAQSGYPTGTLYPPITPTSIAAYAAWAKAAALHFQSQNVIWEVWNEPNTDNFWAPAANVSQYNTLAIATCNAIHGAVPGAAVVGGVTFGMDWNFLTSYVSSGTLDCIDGVSIHPYRWTNPETVTSDVQSLQSLISQYQPTSRATIPVISGEWGYPTQTGAVPLPYQAAAAVRMQLNNLLINVPISIWYDWKNDGTDATNQEQNFGIVTNSLSAKPAYTALLTMSKQLTGYTFVNRVTTASSQDYVLMFVNAQGKRKAVAWTASGTDYATTVLPSLTKSAIAVTITNMSGTNSSAKITAAGVPLTISYAPQYIDLSNVP